MRACFLLKVRPEKMDEYKARHAQVWPEMLKALRESGWRNYSLFLTPDGALIDGRLGTLRRRRRFLLGQYKQQRGAQRPWEEPHEEVQC